MSPKTDDPKKNPAVPPILTAVHVNKFKSCDNKVINIIYLPKKSVKVKITSRWNLISGYFLMVMSAPVLCKNFKKKKIF